MNGVEDGYVRAVDLIFLYGQMVTQSVTVEVNRFFNVSESINRITIVEKLLGCNSLYRFSQFIAIKWITNVHLRGVTR